MSSFPFLLADLRRDNISQLAREDELSKPPRAVSPGDARNDVQRQRGEHMTMGAPPLPERPRDPPILLGRPIPSATPSTPYGQPPNALSDPTTNELQHFEHLEISSGPSRLPKPDFDSSAALNKPHTLLSHPRQSSAKGKERATMVDSKGDLLYWRKYVSEDDDMEDIIRLTEQELSEP